MERLTFRKEKLSKPKANKLLRQDFFSKRPIGCYFFLLSAY